MVNATHDYTERDRVLEQYRKLQAAAYQRRINAALGKTTAKAAKDMALLIFLGALVSAMGWVAYEIWTG